MRKLFLTTVALLAICGPAMAKEYPTAVCGPPTVSPPEYDPNPVVRTEVSYNPETRIWQIFHYLYDGSVVSRAQQYAIVDSSSEGMARWEGDLLRNPTLHMVGTVDMNGHYEERIWNKSLRRWVTRIDTDCTLQRPQAIAPAPIPQGTVLQGYPPQGNGNVYTQTPTPATPPPASTAGGNTIIVIPR